MYIHIYDERLNQINILSKSPICVAFKAGLDQAVAAALISLHKRMGHVVRDFDHLQLALHLSGFPAILGSQVPSCRDFRGEAGACMASMDGLDWTDKYPHSWSVL